MLGWILRFLISQRAFKQGNAGAGNAPAGPGSREVGHLAAVWNLSADQQLDSKCRAAEQLKAAQPTAAYVPSCSTPKGLLGGCAGRLVLRGQLRLRVGCGSSGWSSGEGERAI